MKANTILDTIGNTAHIRINRLFGLTHEVWTKSERANPGGSIKDRIALAMIEAAEATAAEARRHDRGADQRQHGHRPGHGRGGQGLQIDRLHARKHVAGTPRLMKAYGATLDLTPRRRA
jgi:cysteine synthase A